MWVPPRTPPEASLYRYPGTSIENRTKEPSNVANIKSQIKRNKTNEKARERNKAVKKIGRAHV